MKELLKEYENYLLISGKRIKGIRYSMKIFKRYLQENNLELQTLSYRDAQGFQSWLNDQNGRYSPASIQGIIGPLSSFYDYVRKKQLISVNPFHLIERIKIPFRIPGNIPDEKEMDILLNFMAAFTRGKNLREYKRDYKAHILCELLYSTGMRISEAAAIKLDDIDFTAGTVLVHDSKTNSERTAFLNDYVKNILLIYVNEMREKVLWLHSGADSTLLFGSSVNLKTWLNSVLKEVCKTLGRDKVSSHIFRHAFGYHMLKAGCDIRKIQKFLGHKKLDTTGVYTKVDTEALKNILDQYHPRTKIKRAVRSTGDPFLVETKGSL